MTLMPSPGAGFDAPFELMAACHDRVRRSLDLLARLCAHVHQHGAGAQARDAAPDVLRYFDLAAPHHHEDEERHVFPALIAADARRWGALVARLQDDHRRMAAGWGGLRPALQQVAAGQPAPALDSAAAAFAALYAEHLVAEDTQAYPAAAALLGAEALAAIGAEMAARRGATPPPR